MNGSGFRKRALALGLAAMAAGGARAETVDFESAAYAADKTIVGSDGWLLSTGDIGANQDNFKIQAGPAGQGRWVHAQTATATVVYRNLGSALGNANLIDVRWRWRPLSDSAHFCVGVAGSSGSARLAGRALACLEPGGVLSAQGGGLTPTQTAETWHTGTWTYLRMVLDLGAGPSGKFALYVSDDSLRAGERLALPATAMAGAGAITRIALRDEAGSGFVDVDDVELDPIALWQPSADTDSAWNLAKNWSTQAVPDSNTHVLFNELSTRGCFLDKNAAVRSITVTSGFKGTFSLGQQALSVLGNADFTGAAAYPFSGPGHIRFPSARGGSLIGPVGTKILASVRHDGTGTLRLDTRALSAANFTQAAGVLDFNGFDMLVQGDLAIKNGRPGSLRNLDGRALIVNHSARLEGTAKDTLLNLATAKGWTLNLSGTDTLMARYAQLGNARASGAPGYAFLSVDAGGNSGWIFVNPPAFARQPQDTLVKPGETAVFRVSVAVRAGVAYQWLRNDVEIPGAKDSVWSVPGVRKADSGAIFTCKLTNPAGSTVSNPATLRVAFPAPTALPPPQPIVDSLRVQLIPAIAGAKLLFSRNGGPWQDYSGVIPLRDSTTLRAYAVFGGDTSAVAVLTYPKAGLPQLEPPGISPEPSPFTGTLMVTLTPPAAGARVYYTVNDDDPDSTSTLYTAPFPVTGTTSVRAIAYLAGYRPSAIRTHLYTKQGDVPLPPPTAAPAGGAFNDSITVTLSPPADFPKAAVYYLLGSQGPYKYSEPLVLRQSVTLKALAIFDLRISDTAQWEFARRLEAPIASPKGRIFHDTLRVQASSTTAGADIRYTLDGSEPGPGSPLFPGKGILLDSTTELKAVAVKGAEVSAVLDQTYTLIPDTPSVSPHGGDYSSRISITLQSGAPRAVLYYTLDGTTPGPERGLPPYSGPIVLDTSATLKAVAVTGVGTKTQRSPLRIENYAFIVPGKRTLAPGGRVELSGNYSLASPNGGASPVIVEVIAADTVALGLQGFRDVLFGIRVSLPEGAAAFPSVLFNAPSGETRSLFQLIAPKTVRWITSADTSGLAGPGTYFLAVDTMAPTVRWSGETFTAEDSTRLVVTIEDNVQNLSLDLDRSDDKTLGFTDREVNPILILAVNVKNKPGAIQPLTVRLRVDDHTRATAFPPDGSAYPLAQKFPDGLRSPAAFHVGDDAQDPWDFIAVPLATEKPLTLSQLRKNNAVPGLQGAFLDPATGKYRFLGGDEPLLPGAGIWLAAPASVPSLVFPALQTAPHRGTATYRLTLRHGWNQVANPTLAQLWWPVTRAYPEAYQASLLKGLNAWDPGAGTYVHAETLAPWRGYFAYYKGTRDTVIELLDHAPPAPVATPPKAKAAAAASASAQRPGFELTLAWPGGASLHLGAADGAVDGIGLEDEARPPARDEAGTRVYSAREASRLETDVAGWKPGAVYAWKVVAGLSARARNREATVTPLMTRAGALPEGYAAWAVSPSRGLRFPLDAGSAIPWNPGYADTLEVLAGPAADLEARLAQVPLKAGPFAARIAPAFGGYGLDLDLPAAARLRFTTFTLDGRIAEDRVLDLPEGRFHLAGNRGGAGYARGLYALRIEASGPAAGGAVPPRMALKFAIP